MSDESMLPPAEKVDTGAETSEEVQATEPTAEASAWQWNDDLPGSGDAPEWLKADKYGSVAEQAKAYTELEKRFGSFTGAPEEYEVPDADQFAKDIDLPEGLDFNLDKEDPLLQSFSEQAREMGINQEGFNKLVGLYIQQQVNDYAENMTTADEQKKLLGDNADERLGNIARWGKANMDEEMYNHLASSLTTAASVEAVEYLIGKTRNSSLPNPAQVSPAPAVSKADYESELAKRGPNGEWLMETDPAHRQKVERMGKQLFGTEPLRQVMG